MNVFHWITIFKIICTCMFNSMFIKNSEIVIFLMIFFTVFFGMINTVNLFKMYWKKNVYKR